MFDIDLQSRVPVYEQLYKRVTELIVAGQLKNGDRLPSVRELAKELGVNPNTVSKAFQILERDRIINTVPGKGSFISPDNAAVIRENAMAEFTAAAQSAYNAGLGYEDMLRTLKKITGICGKDVTDNDKA